MKKQLIFSALALLFLFLGTTAAVLYGRGYRFGLDGGRPDLSGTGILVATSTPNGASVFINDHLTTATDNTINLPPGDYDVKITKEGYLPWEKKMIVQKEVVSKADALLFPTAPKLDSVTDLGANNPVIDPTLSKVAYTISSQSAKINGIYILDMSQRPIITLQSSSTQIIDDTSDTFSKAELAWSPDGSQILATVGSTTYLLSSRSFNDTPQDVTETLDSVKASWEAQKATKEKALLATLKPTLASLITDNMSVISWSDDNTKILYSASKSATLPFVITPRIIGSDSTPEDRNIKAGSVYVYDITEDRNYKINVDGTTMNIPQDVTGNLWNSLMWLPDSLHLLYTHDKQVDIMEYDAMNETTIYAGPFTDNYVFPWQNMSKVLILTNLGNSQISPNLYTIALQ